MESFGLENLFDLLVTLEVVDSIRQQDKVHRTLCSDLIFTVAFHITLQTLPTENGKRETYKQTPPK